MKYGYELKDKTKTKTTKANLIPQNRRSLGVKVNTSILPAAKLYDSDP
jgi:hypothetical protein